MERYITVQEYKELVANNVKLREDVEILKSQAKGNAHYGKMYCEAIRTVGKLQAENAKLKKEVEEREYWCQNKAIRELKAENVHFKDEVVQLKEDSERLKRIHTNELCIKELANTNLQYKLDTANKRIEEYQEFIDNYQAHDTLCRATADQPTKDCDCGLEEALRALKGVS